MAPADLSANPRAAAAPATVPRTLSLDLLRAVAILLVLCRHTADPPPLPAPWSTLLGALHCGGWVGVDLFFVLSGFLVSGLLFKEAQRSGELRWQRFLLRRGFKIYPSFYLMIALSMLALWRHGQLQGRPALAELLFFQNYVPGLWNHTWSLAVEEHFYLLLPLLLLGLLRWGPRGRDPFHLVPWVWLGTATLLLGLRLAHAAQAFGYWTHLMPTHLRIDSLLLGVAISYAFHYRPDWTRRLARLRLPLGLLGAGLLAPAFAAELDRTPWIYTVGFTLFALGSGCILIALQGSFPENRLTRAAAFVGSRSYSIYVWHIPLRYWISDKLAARLGWGFLGSSALFALLSIALGIALAAAIEQPMLRLRDHLFPAGPAVPPPAPAIAVDVSPSASFAPGP